MEIQVVIVGCKNCIFTQNAETAILESLDSINKGDIGNISLRVTLFDLRELCHNSVAVTVRKAKVQIVIVTHNFLDELKNSGGKNYCQVHLNRVLHSKGVICVLMRIDAQEILQSYSNLLPHFLDWNVLELRANKKLDHNFTKTFQEHVIQCYNNRAKHNESKILRFDTPFWTSMSSPFLSPSSPEIVNNVKPLLLSTTSDEGRETITVKLNEPVSPSDELRIQLRKGDEIYSTVVQIPDNLTCRESMQGSIVKIEAPFLLVSQSFPNADDPIDQMLLKFPGYQKYLDDHLSQALEQVYSSGASLDRLTLLQEFLNGREHILLSVLHFGAYYGLKQSVRIQLEKGDGAKFIHLSNSNGDTPLDIALFRGHDAVGKILKEYEGLISTLEAIQNSSTLINNSIMQEVESKEIEEEVGMTTSNNDHEIEADSRATIYINIEVVPPPALPEKKPVTASGEYINPRTVEAIASEYCVPPTSTKPCIPNSGEYINPRTVQAISSEYCVPPTLTKPSSMLSNSNSEYQIPPQYALPVVLFKKDGTLQRNNDYIQIPKPDGQRKGDTLKTLNLNPIRISTVSNFSTSDEDFDDDEPKNIYDRPVPTLPSVQDQGDDDTFVSGYSKPLPLLPSVTEEANLKSKPEVKLEPVEEELVKLIQKALTGDPDPAEVLEMLRKWQHDPLVVASDEQKFNDLEKIRAEYFEMQKNKKGESKEGGFLERVVKGIKNAKKKISNTGIRSSSDPSAEDYRHEQIIITPPASPQTLHINNLTMPNFPNRRRSSSLTILQECVESPSNNERIRAKSESRRRFGTSYISPLVMTGLEVNAQYISENGSTNSVSTQGDNNGIPLEQSEPSMLESIMDGLKERNTEMRTYYKITTENIETDEMSPPPRPPKRIFVKNSSPSPSTVDSQLQNDSDVKNFTPPKPMRRNVKKTTHYINYNDTDT